jgi:hypothetical protein
MHRYVLSDAVKERLLRRQGSPVQVVTLRNRTPNPIAKLFIDELRTFSKPATKLRGTRRR